MNTDTGTIYTPEQMRKLRNAFGSMTDRQLHLKQMEHGPTDEQILKGRVGRNDPCPCGSGRKFKRCCCTAKGRP